MSDLRVTTFVNGKWRQNCYLISNTQREALIIDPGSDPEGISELITELGVRPVAILNTHAHYDHVGAISVLLQKYEIPFFLHGDDAKLLKQANLYKILFETKNSISIPPFGEDFDKGPEDLNVAGFSVRVIHTPGHTAGGVCLLIGGNLFSGDTLMLGGPGRTDLPGGDKVKLKDSLQKLRELPEDYLVYAGHGRPFMLQEFWKKNDEQ
ncbi:MAG: MBL fold metallo-hydrolase [Polaromonas sp.]|uniref:MBL fold metallo-hydrolase n=1 Tax=Polaromonas sp. TaxID=1869339 RepID=UPI00273758CC|nr:MBL fold metallo-hydrolase [Polaromonas sp.]MDP3798971.1 MBL fold metallo-hydrolase [Polaromonas sp.]